MENISRQIMVILSCQTIASQNSLIIVSHTVPNLQFLSKKFNPNLMKSFENIFKFGRKNSIKSYLNFWTKSESTRCLKITEKVSFNIVSAVNYAYILSGQKLIKNAKNGPFWRVFENLKLAVKQCYQTCQF